MPADKKKEMVKPKNPGQTLKRIFSYMKEYKLQIVFVIIGILISSGANVAATYFLKPVINKYIVPFIGQQNPDMSDFASTIIIMAVVMLLGVIASYVYNRLMVNIATGTLYKIRVDMFTHMQKLPIRYFDTHTHGDLMSRYSNDTDTLREMLGQGVPQLISSLITVVGVFIAMVVMSPLLTLVVMAILAIMLLVIKVIGGRSANYFIRQQQAVGAVNRYIEEMIEGQKVVKVFCHEEKVIKDFDKLNEDLCHASTNANAYANMLMPIMNNLAYIEYALVASVGAVMTINGMLDVGTTASFIQYTRSFSMPITQISQQLNSVLSALAGAERIFAMIDEEPEVDDGYVELVNAEIDSDGKITETKKYTGKWAWKHPHHDGTLTYTQLKGDVVFEDVTFGYNSDKTVLKGVSLYANAGQKIAFVGSTGAGKTTITNLINRFYDVPDGKIRYDGININKIRKADLRRSLSMVLQDTHLFTGTVKDNIRYGKFDATDEEIIEASKLANADTFIRHLPDGYDTMITADGGNLSQGQRQLIAIARAAVANPPVLILDEATSSIDTRTESLIEKGMDKLMQGRTVFVIAHRLSTVRNSNAIMVLENGQIIERGNHDSLIEKKGKYYQLYTGMFELS